MNHFRLQDNNTIWECASMVFKTSVCKVISSEILHNMPALKLCHSLVKNGLSSRDELQILIASLSKLEDETSIIQTDSEQEALYKLRCRIIACEIAKELYVRGIESDSIDEWKRISQNQNEFIEIRNIVFNVAKD